MKIVNYREINKGCLKASFTIIIEDWGNMEIDCVFFEKGNGSFWLNYAPKEYTDRQGNKKSFNQFRLPQEAKDRLEKAVRAKISKGEFEMKAPKEEKPVPEPICSNDDDGVPF